MNYGVGDSVGEEPVVGETAGTGVGSTVALGVGVEFADDPLKTILGVLLFVSVNENESVVSWIERATVPVTCDETEKLACPF